MRRAFTMIELIFVIVILSILASIMVPKLMTSRDDALIAKRSMELSTIIMDLGNYYTSHNNFSINIQDMTSVNLSSDYNMVLKNSKCLKFKIVNTNGIVQITQGEDYSASICAKFLNIPSVASMIKQHRFGGYNVISN